MNRFLLTFFLCIYQFYSFGQQHNIRPNSAFVGETLNTTITVANSIAFAASPPTQQSDIYLEQNGFRIFTDAYTIAQAYLTFWGGFDSLQTDFTIPAGAPLGYYDVHTITYAGQFPQTPVDNVFTNGFLVRAIGSCPVPSSVTAGSITNTSVLISWAAMTADTFRIRYHVNGSTNYSYRDVDGTLNPTSTTLTNLLPGTLYNVEISTICDGIRSAYSLPVVTFTTAALPVSCIIPFDLDSSSVTNTTATISWSSLVTSDTFRIRYSIDGTSNYLYKDINGAFHSAALTNLFPGTAYNVRISSKCLGVSTGYSTPFIFTTASQALNCSVPFNITAGNITPTSAIISWTNLVVSDTFRIRYAINNTTNYFYINTNGAAPHSTTLAGLLAGTDYSIQIASICNGISSGYSSPVIFTTSGVLFACAVPFNVIVSSVTNTGAQVDWTNTITSDTFRIRYLVTGSNNYQYRNINGAAPHSFTLTNLQPGTSYDLQMSSVCNGSGTSYCPVQSFTTTNTPVACGIPFTLSSSNYTNNSADVSWTTLVTADSFLVRYSVSGTTNYLWKQIPGSLHSTTLTGLSANTNYQWQVRSVCTALGLTPYSASATFGTQLRLAAADVSSEILEVFPNPAKEFINIRFSSSLDLKLTIQVVDISGKVVRNESADAAGGENNYEINLQDMSRGIYFVLLSTSDKTYRQKLVVE